MLDAFDHCSNSKHISSELRACKFKGNVLNIDRNKPTNRASISKNKFYHVSCCALLCTSTSTSSKHDLAELAVLYWLGFSVSSPARHGSAYVSTFFTGKVITDRACTNIPLVHSCNRCAPRLFRFSRRRRQSTASRAAPCRGNGGSRRRRQSTASRAVPCRGNVHRRPSSSGGTAWHRAGTGPRDDSSVEILRCPDLCRVHCAARNADRSSVECSKCRVRCSA